MAMEKAKALVEQNGLVVFSKTWCPYCVTVKKLFDKLGAKQKVVELDEEDDGQDIQNALCEWTGQRTVPNVFIGGVHIGGCDDTMGIHSEGNLTPKLRDAGVLEEKA